MKKLPDGWADLRAQELFDRIPIGHAEPLKRPLNKSVDRLLRDKVNTANLTDTTIINVGNGYYKPDLHNIVDLKEFNEYLAKDLSRIKDLWLKRKAMLQRAEMQDQIDFAEWLKEKDNEIKTRCDG